MKYLAALLLSSLALPLLAAPAVSYLKPYMHFTKTRALLLKDAWEPVPMHVGENYQYDGVEKELVRRKYMEVNSCSNDSARCVLYYRKAGACLRVDIIGEHVRGMKLVRWTDECPSPGTPSKK